MNEEKKAIKILAVMSSPVIMKRKNGDEPIEKVTPLFIEDEWYALKEAVQGIDVRLERCYPATLNRLDDMLHLAASPKRKEPYEIVHFSGHGDIGTLLFEDGNLAGVDVNADSLGELFKKTGVKVVILSACYSGKEDINKSVISPATLLAETYVPAVIYTNDRIRIDVAKEFSATLFNRISSGWTVVESFKDAQRKVKNHPELRGTQKTVFEYKCPDDFALNGTPVEPDIIDAVPPHDARLFENPYFFGREQELAEISVLMGDKKDRVITVTGIGGSGKTALAKELARRNAWRYPGGLVWADFREAGAAGPGTLLEAVREQLSVGVSEPAKYEEEIIARLGEAPGLVVCDNVETVAVAARGDSETDREAANKLIELITNLPPNVQVLCTGREPLGAPAEHTKHIIGLDPVAAARYFLEVARDKGREIDADDEKAVAELLGVVEAVSRIPLAVYLAASTYADSTMSLDELRRGLEEACGEILVDEDMTGADAERHRSIEASINYSLGLLESDAARELFPKLGIFSPAAGFDDGAAENVCGVNDWESGLRELVRKSLVEKYELGKDYFRYNLFPPVAEHAMGMTDGGKGLEEPFTDFYSGRGGGAYLLISESENIQLGMTILDMEHANLTRALEMSYENDWDEKIGGFNDILDTFYSNKFAYEDRRTLLKRALEHYQGKEAQREVAVVYHQLGMLAADLFKYDEAMGYYEQSKEIKEEIGDRRGAAYTLGQMGNLVTELNEYEKAKSLYDEVYVISKEIGDRASEAKALHQMGMLAADQKNYDEAMSYYEQSKEIEEEIGNKKGVAESLHQMGITAAAQKDYDEAMRYYEQSKELKEEIGDRKGVANSLHQMGRLAAVQKDHDGALGYYGQSLEIESEIGNKQGIVTSTWVIGDIYRAQSKMVGAIAAYLQALFLAQEIGFEDAVFGTLNGMYDCYVEVGEESFNAHFAAAARGLGLSDEAAQGNLVDLYSMFEVIAERLQAEKGEETG